MEKQRVIYFDYLRIISVFSVVFLHIAAQNWYSTSVNSFEWRVFNFYDGLVQWGVPIFVMISGTLFLGKEYSIRKLYTHNVLRIFVVFFFWSSIYAIWTCFILNDFISINGLVGEVLFGHYHLWFLYLIIGLYMIVPFLKRIVENKTLAWYYVILSLFFAFVIPELIQIIGIYHENVAHILNSLVSKLELHLILGYSGYFVLGYLINCYEIKKRTEFLLYSASLLGFLLTLLSSYAISLQSQSPTNGFNGNLTIQTLSISVAVFVFAKNHLSNPPLENRRRLLSFLSKCSFGVYLIHPFVMEFFEKYLSLSSLSFNPIFSVPSITLIVFIISILLSALINKIPIAKKWIV